MPSLKMKVPHGLAQPEALTRIKNLLNTLKREQNDKISNVKESWTDESGNFQFTAQGFNIAGVIHVHPSSIDINADVPFAVSLFKGKIKKLIEEKAKELLS